MNDAAIQRFALLIVVFGGFIDLSGRVQGDYSGLPSYGTPLMILGLLIGILGLYFGVASSASK